MALNRYRRVWARRRRPLRRSGAYRRKRRGFRRRFRAGKGTFKVKLTRVVTLDIPLSTTGQFGFDIRANDFAEYISLAKNFEAYRFTKCVVKVVPMQNTCTRLRETGPGNGDAGANIVYSDILPLYALFPWHKPLPDKANFNNYLSIDRCKTYRMSTSAKMTFVPSTLESVQYRKGAGDWQTTENQVKWRPRIEIIDENSGNIVFYTGALGFEALPSGVDQDIAHFNVIINMYCTFYNQRTLGTN
uniref:Capsid protein n=1 Tax=Myotis capaccinii feces associated cyclovirus 2 TaxID=3139989 RepID=A0AAU6S523_9CIRC